MGIFIRNAHVITMDSSTGSEPIVRSIRIENDVVTAVAGDLVPADGDTIIDGRDRLVTPGFVNAHTHSWETFYKGRYDNLPLEMWMAMAYPILGDSRVEPDLVRLRSTLFAIESLEAGVTTIVDDVLENPTQDWAQLSAVFDAYEEIGIRANISGHVISKPFVDTVPFIAGYLSPEVTSEIRSHPVPTTQEYLAFSRRAFEQYHGRGNGRLRYMVAPSAPQRCGADLLVGATQLATEFDAECHIHVLETKTQLVTGTEMYGGSLVEYMDRIGALSPNTTLAHGIWLTEDDLSMIASAGTSISHNPISNLKLGSGIAPWHALRTAGVNLGLGTDGCSSSDSPRMLDVVKAAALLHKVTNPDFTTWPTVDEVLHAGTVGGARSALLQDTVGTVEVGMQADLGDLRPRHHGFHASAEARPATGVLRERLLDRYRDRGGPDRRRGRTRHHSRPFGGAGRTRRAARRDRGTPECTRFVEQAPAGCAGDHVRQGDCDPRHRQPIQRRRTRVARLNGGAGKR
ncbi:MAG: amidohydrolase family protein [Rhodococcus sp. (in: high G+C Gram-positive bacteria)]